MGAAGAIIEGGAAGAMIGSGAAGALIWSGDIKNFIKKAPKTNIPVKLTVI